MLRVRPLLSGSTSLVCNARNLGSLGVSVVVDISLYYFLYCYFIVCFFLQLVSKDQVYVCPGGGPPRSLPAGVLPDAVQAGVNLDSALKQV